MARSGKAPHIIDKGIPTASLLAQVLVAKYADHLRGTAAAPLASVASLTATLISFH